MVTLRLEFVYLCLIRILLYLTGGGVTVQPYASWRNAQTCMGTMCEEVIINKRSCFYQYLNDIAGRNRYRHTFYPTCCPPFCLLLSIFPCNLNVLVRRQNPPVRTAGLYAYGEQLVVSNLQVLTI
jgi:hypothetical protein